jgi:hypothetical protein
VYPVLSQMNVVHIHTSFIETHFNIISGRGSSLSRYSDWAMGWTVRVWNPVGARDFCLLENVHTGSGAQPVFYSVGVEVLFWG